MTLVTPNDKTLLNVVAHYDREIEGAPLSQNNLTRIAEAAKRLILDELHSAKAATR